MSDSTVDQLTEEARIMSEFMDLGRKILQILAKDEAETYKIPDLRQRCPKCGFVAVEIFDLTRPYTGKTGIYRCLNDDCIVDSFDPTLPEVMP